MTSYYPWLFEATPDRRLKTDAAVISPRTAESEGTPLPRENFRLPAFCCGVFGCIVVALQVLKVDFGTKKTSLHTVHVAILELNVQ